MKRIFELQKRLQGWKIEKLLIENPIDLFYLTHLQLSKGRLWVYSDRAELWVDGRYFDEAVLHSPCPVFLWQKPGKAQEGKIGFDSNWTTVLNLETLKFESPQAEWVGIPTPTISQRLIKDAKEIKNLQEAARITWDGIQHIRALFREGISEEELSIEFEIFVRKHGANRLSFNPIIAFGENSAYPHHRASKTKLKKDEIVLIDVGVVFNHYCSDVTRVYFFGNPNPHLQEMLRLVRESDLVARKQVRPGALVGSVDRAVRDYFKLANVEHLFSHSLGHGLGLEEHESPLIRWDGNDRDKIISSGMVIAIEPGLYQPGLGGIRYENSGIVTNNGFESFYPSD